MTLEDSYWDHLMKVPAGALEAFWQTLHRICISSVTCRDNSYSIAFTQLATTAHWT
jgi:hypothetical protein